jgi:hypothetical protein
VTHNAQGCLWTVQNRQICTSHGERISAACSRKSCQCDRVDTCSSDEYQSATCSVDDSKAGGSVLGQVRYPGQESKEWASKGARRIITVTNSSWEGWHCLTLEEVPRPARVESTRTAPTPLQGSVLNVHRRYPSPGMTSDRAAVRGPTPKLCGSICSIHSKHLVSIGGTYKGRLGRKN